MFIVALEPEVQGYDTHFALEHVNSRTCHVYICKMVLSRHEVNNYSITEFTL